MHDLELLGEHLDAHGCLREGEAEGAVLALHPACAEPELDPPAGHVVGGGGRVREERGCAEGGGGDERAEPKPRRACGERSDRRPGVVRDVRALVRLRDVVVGAEQRVDAVRLAGLRERAPLLPGHALLPLDHQRDAHRREPTVWRRSDAATRLV